MMLKIKKKYIIKNWEHTNVVTKYTEDDFNDFFSCSASLHLSDRRETAVVCHPVVKFTSKTLLIIFRDNMMLCFSFTFNIIYYLSFQGNF